MSAIAPDSLAADVDRVRELTSIGAGHAANALGRMLGRTCRMRVPTVRVLQAERIHAPFVADVRGDLRHDPVGVFFEVEGGLGGVLALLLSARTCGELVTQLVGRPAAEVAADTAASALRELGNILVSHVVSAMADTLGEAVLPSVPLLATEDAPGAFASLVATRHGDHSVLRIETEISDRAGDLSALLVFVPDRVGPIAPSRAF